MIYSTIEGIHYALFPYLGLPTAHTQLTQNGGQGRRPTTTINSMKRTIPALAALTLALGLAACSDSEEITQSPTATSTTTSTPTPTPTPTETVTVTSTGDGRAQCQHAIDTIQTFTETPPERATNFSLAWEIMVGEFEIYATTTQDEDLAVHLTHAVYEYTLWETQDLAGIPSDGSAFIEATGTIIDYCHATYGTTPSGK